MSTNEVMLASFYAMLRVFLTSSVGVLIASYPAGNVIFPPSCMQQISRVSNFVFLPFLIVYSMASALTLPLLLKGSVLILFSIISGLVSLALAGSLEWVHDDARFGRAITIAVATPNQLSLPIMVLTSMCGNGIVNADFGGDTQTCSNEAMSLLFVYSIGFSLVFWGYGFPVLESLRDGDRWPEVALLNKGVKGVEGGEELHVEFGMVDLGLDGTTGGSTAATGGSGGAGGVGGCDTKHEHEHESTTTLTPLQTCVHVLTKSFLNVNMMAQYTGVALAVIPGVQAFVFDAESPVRPLQEAIFTLGQPLVCVNCLVMAGSLTLTKSTYSLEYFGLGWLSPTPALTSTSSSTRVKAAATTSAAVVTAAAAAAAVPVSDCEGVRGGEKEADPDRPPLKSLILHTVLRLFVMPAIILGLLKAALTVGLVGKEDRLIQLIIVVEGAAPSAQMMLVALNQLGLRDVAGRLAFMYVPHYLLSIVTITVWTTIGSQTIYTD